MAARIKLASHIHYHYLSDEFSIFTLGAPDILAMLSLSYITTAAVQPVLFTTTEAARASFEVGT